MDLTIGTAVISQGDKHVLRVESTDPETMEFFTDRGLDGNGYTWAAVVDSVARLELASHYGKLDWSPEADNLLVTSSELALLHQLESHVRQYVDDKSKMELALANADSEMLE